MRPLRALTAVLAMLGVLGGLSGLGGFGGFLSSPAPLGAQVVPPSLPAPAPWMRPADAAVPYAPGERLTYEVKLGWFSVGEGHMSVVGIDTVRGRPAYHVQLGIKGGIPMARVNSTFSSWIDTRNLASRRFIQDQDEVGTKRFRHYEIFPEEGRFERVDEDADAEDNDTFATDIPLDDISFVYFVRTVPLVVGETYTYNRYFKEESNPVILQVVRKDRVTVPAGTFNTIVVRPVIKTRGLFGEGGEAELHFTDDSRRILVMMTSKVPVMGSLSLHLRTIEEGRTARRPESE